MTHPVQYLSPWFRHVHAHADALDFTVVYAGSEDALIKIDIQFFDHASLLGTGKSYSKQGELAWQHALRPGNFLEAHFPLSIRTPHDINDFQTCQFSVAVADKLLGKNSPLAVNALFLRR